MSWSVILKRDGHEVVEAPVDEWIAAQVLAETTVAIWGGPVSVVNAVVANRPAVEQDPTIFDALDDVA
jgi:hypothetical protein